MPTFYYNAKDIEGREIRGSIEAPNPSAAAAELRTQGYYVIGLEQSRESRSSGGAGEGLAARVIPPVSLNKRMQFWRQLQSYIKAGVSPAQALDEIGAGYSGYFGRVVRNLAKLCAEGVALSQALIQYPATFPVAEVSIIRAGEETGKTDDAIKTLAELNESEAHTRREFALQLAYPLLVFVGLLFIPLLPGLILYGPEEMIRVVTRRYVPAASTVIAIFLASRLLFAVSPDAKRIWDLVKLRMPLLGVIVNKIAAVKAARTISTAERSGLNIALSLELASQTCGNSALGERFKSAIPFIHRGEPLTDALVRTQAFPLRVVQLLKTGEATGDIASMMDKAADYFEAEARSAIRISLIVFGVALILVAAYFVLRYAMDVMGGVIKQYPVN